MTIPGMPSHGLPPTWDSLARRLDMLQRQINTLKHARTLGNSSINEGNLVIRGGGVRIEDADGNLLLTLDKDGLTATQLGRIGNASLASPVTPRRVGGDNDSTTLTTSGDNPIHTETITVPEGYTTANVMAIISVGNTRASNAGPAPLYGGADIYVPRTQEDWASSWIATTCADGGSASVTTGVSGNVSDLQSGDEVQISAWGFVDDTTGWKAGAANGHVDAVAIFFR